MPEATTTASVAPPNARQQRTFTLIVERAADASATSIPVAISSEAPVERYDHRTGEQYLEVLDHAPGSVDLSYARDGLPFCLDHDLGRQIGILKNVRVDTDRRMRGELTIGNHPDAAWVLADILAGIRNKVSIGYAAGSEYEQSKTKPGETPSRRYRGWTPFEASSVPIPADYNVGVGRSTSDNPALRTGALPTRTDMHDNTPLPTREQQLASLATQHHRQNDLPNWITEGRSVQDVKDMLLTEITERNSQRPPISSQPNYASRIAHRAHIAPHDSDEVAAFMSPESSAARNATAQLTRDMGFAPRLGGNFMPFDVNGLNRPSNSRVFTTTGSTTGQELVPSIQQSFSDRLRADLLAAELGVRFVPMSGGTAAFPVATADPTVVEIAENPGSGASLSDPALATRTAIPKAAVIRTAVSNHIALASTPEAIGVINTIMARTFAGHVDGRIFAGPTGGNGPIGAFYTSGISTVGLAADGAALDYDGLIAMEKALVDANGEGDDVAIITTSAVRAALQKTQDFPTAAAGRPLWDNGRVLGRQAFARSWMPSTLTKGTGTGLHGLLMLSPRRVGLMAVTWPAIEITVDRLTGADKQLTYITGALYYDVVTLHPGAVVRSADIDVS